MAQIDELIPDGLTAEEWDTAHRRVWAYLAALGVRHEFLLHRCVSQIMQHCESRLAEGAPSDVVSMAANEVEQQVVDWFRSLLAIASDDPIGQDAAVISLRGRLAMLLADMPTHWHGVFLTDPPWPEAFVRSVRESYLEAVPSLLRGHMTAPPLDLGRVPQLADRALRTIDRTFWLRMTLLWGGSAALFVFLFWLTR
jgi:hypothetical protein